jgi:hypothetical protein
MRIPKAKAWKVAELMSRIDWDCLQGQQYKVNVLEFFMNTLGLVLDYYVNDYMRVGTWKLTTMIVTVRLGTWKLDSID